MPRWGRRNRRFQPTSPVRETTLLVYPNANVKVISTHVPRAGDDRRLEEDIRHGLKFQPTSPVRETTKSFPPGLRDFFISTHVPRAGDDLVMLAVRFIILHFNPRPPCGRRLPSWEVHQQIRAKFQPTSPVRETTRSEAAGQLEPGAFQPTSPVRETTRSGCRPVNAGKDFNPRPPCGRRLCRMACLWADTYFNPRPPCGRRRLHAVTADTGNIDFNPRPPCGRRLRGSAPLGLQYIFQPTSPVRETTRQMHRYLRKG